MIYLYKIILLFILQFVQLSTFSQELRREKVEQEDYWDSTWNKKNINKTEKVAKTAILIGIIITSIGLLEGSRYNPTATVPLIAGGIFITTGTLTLNKCRVLKNKRSKPKY